MNMSKKVISVLLALVTLMSLLCVGAAVSAAPGTATEDRVVVKVYAGEKASIPFYVNAYGCNGEFEISNRNLFSNLEVAETSGTISIDTQKFSYHSTIKDIKGFTLSGTVNSSAKVGDTCEISVTYTRVDNMTATEFEKGLVKKIIVEVVKKPTTSSSSTTSSTTQTTTSSTRPSTRPSGSTGTTGTTKTPGTNLDLTELERQIGIAATLVQTEYTTESWEKLESALEAAKKARKADTQAEVNKAADALKQAIADLVRIDGDALRDLLSQVRSFLAEDDLASIWGDLLEAIEDAEAALLSGDQAAVDEAYNNLLAAFEAFKAKLAELGKGEPVVEQVEVKGECDEDCHKWNIHLLWLILLIISAILNVFFIVLIVLYFIKRKKNAADNTPLVDYDINDD